MVAKRNFKTVPDVKDDANINKTCPLVLNGVSFVLNGTSNACDACNFCSDVHECINRFRAYSLATIPNRVVESKRLISMQPALQKVVPTSLQKSANGVTTLHPALGCTIAGAGIITDSVSIGLNILKNGRSGKMYKSKNITRINYRI